MSHLSMDELSASLDGALTGADQERTRAHLSMCPRCRERQARLALHDDALRRLLADDPDDRAMDELARRSEAIAAAIVRGLPVPPIAASTLEPSMPPAPAPRPTPVREYGPIETLSRFAPPAQAAPPTVEQDTHATPARAEEPLPPPRNPSRALRRPDAVAPATPLDVTPRLDTDRPQPQRQLQPVQPAQTPQTPKAPEPLPASQAQQPAQPPKAPQPLLAPLAPEPTPAPQAKTPGPAQPPAPEAPKAPRVLSVTNEAKAPKPERKPETLAESYDAFNDSAYVGPDPGQRPPMIGEAPGKRPPDADLESPRKEYRHGGVRREAPGAAGSGAAGSTPVRGASAGDSGERVGEPGSRRRRTDESERAKAAARDDGFGVRRKEEPAWARLGLEPDPFAPGQFRDALTGAMVTPPPVTNRPPAPRAGRGGSGSRTALIATLATVGGLIVVVLALRIPTAAHMSVQWGRPKASDPQGSTQKLDIHDATTTPPVETIVPQPGHPAQQGPAPTPEPPRLCGQLVDAQGRPLADATISVVGGGPSVRCDADGRFCLAAPAGAHDVEVVDPRAAGSSPRRLRMEWVAGAPESRIVLP